MSPSIRPGRSTSSRQQSKVAPEKRTRRARGAGRWYRGDFHVHSTASDGRYPPPVVARLCREHGLDFFVITDHNALCPLEEFGEAPGVLVIAGLEVTLEEGHWNVLGIDGWQAWMEDVCTGEITIPLSDKYSGTSQLLALTGDGAVLNSMNHPFLPPWEWSDPDTDLRLIDAIEVWNDPLWPANRQATPRAVAFWRACLDAGLRLTAVGGSDFHVLPGEADPYPGERPGLPVTYVYARELSKQGILDGVRSGRAYVTMGPKVDLWADAAGKRCVMGGQVPRRSTRIEVEARASDAPAGGSLRVMTHQGPLAAAPIVDGAAEATGALTLGDERFPWVTAEVLDASGDLVAITNPIFVGARPQLERITFGEIASRVAA